MTNSQIFFNFLKLTYPSIAKKFKKRGNETYVTYQNIGDTGHKFIYNTKKQSITHLFYKVIFEANEYRKELVSETVKVLMLKNGFKTVKI